MHYRTIDIFCHVVDNFGDIGFVYRFAREFGALNPHCAIRVFVDDVKTLQAVNPSIDPAKSAQTVDGIEFISYDALTDDFVGQVDIADVLDEAFACRIPEPVMKAVSSDPRSRLIINLEHLSAEPWVEGYHLKPSLLPQENLKKYFFMPGLTEKTGGVVVDRRIERSRPRLAAHRVRCLTGLLAQAGHHIDEMENMLVGTVFTYERGFDTLIADLGMHPGPSLLLVFGEKSQRGMQSTFDRIGGRQIRRNCFTHGNVTALFMPFILQPRYDALLCCADFNIVRGEDSLVRALLAGKPFIWNAYLQEEKYHKVKVDALLNWGERFFKEDKDVFTGFRNLQLAFNDAASESSNHITGEQYLHFFTNLTKIEHATRAMSYFLARNCDLVKRFSAFISSL